MCFWSVFLRVNHWLSVRFHRCCFDLTWTCDLVGSALSDLPWLFIIIILVFVPPPKNENKSVYEQLIPVVGVLWGLKKSNEDFYTLFYNLVKWRAFWFLLLLIVFGIFSYQNQKSTSPLFLQLLSNLNLIKTCTKYHSDLPPSSSRIHLLPVIFFILSSLSQNSTSSSKTCYFGYVLQRNTLTFCDVTWNFFVFEIFCAS